MTDFGKPKKPPGGDFIHHEVIPWTAYVSQASSMSKDHIRFGASSRTKKRGEVPPTDWP
jgi:hypothetical protein